MMLDLRPALECPRMGVRAGERTRGKHGFVRVWRFVASQEGGAAVAAEPGTVEEPGREDGAAPGGARRRVAAVRAAGWIVGGLSVIALMTLYAHP